MDKEMKNRAATEVADFWFKRPASTRDNLVGLDEGAMSIMSRLPSRPVDSSTSNKFETARDNLRQSLMKNMRDVPLEDVNVTTRTDYHAEGLLEEACKSAKIGTFLSLPTKTSVCIKYDEKNKNLKVYKY